MTPCGRAHGPPAPGRATPGCNPPASSDRPSRRSRLAQQNEAAVRRDQSAPEMAGGHRSCDLRLEDSNGSSRYLRSWWAWLLSLPGGKVIAFSDNDFLPNTKDLRHRPPSHRRTATNKAAASSGLARIHHQQRSVPGRSETGVGAEIVRAVLMPCLKCLGVTPTIAPSHFSPGKPG